MLPEGYWASSRWVVWTVNLSKVFWATLECPFTKGVCIDCLSSEPSHEFVLMCSLKLSNRVTSCAPVFAHWPRWIVSTRSTNCNSFSLWRILVVWTFFYQSFVMPLRPRWQPCMMDRSAACFPHPVRSSMWWVLLSLELSHRLHLQRCATKHLLCRRSLWLHQLLELMARRSIHRCMCGRGLCVSCPSTSRRTGAIPKWWPSQLPIPRCTPTWVGSRRMVKSLWGCKILQTIWLQLDGPSTWRMIRSTTLAHVMSDASSENNPHGAFPFGHVGWKVLSSFCIGSVN